eukprot:gene3072-3841_t
MFSNYILLNILQQIDEDIDKISFLFTSKTILQWRDRVFSKYIQPIRLYQSPLSQQQQQRYPIFQSSLPSKIYSTRPDILEAPFIKDGVVEKKIATHLLIDYSILAQNLNDIESLNFCHPTADLSSIVSGKLKSLEIGSSYRKPITPFSIPSSVTKLLLNQELGCIDDQEQNQQYTKDIFPAGLEKLKILEPIPKLTSLGSMDFFPSSLTHLEFDMKLPQTVPISLPSTITHLGVGNQFFVSGSKLPPNLYKLTLFAGTLLAHNMIPPSVKYLKIFGSLQNDIIEPGMIPMGVEKVKFNIYGEILTQLVVGSLPRSIIELEIGTEYNFELVQGIIPDSTKYLKLLQFIDYPLEPGIIPQSVQELQLGLKLNNDGNIKHILLPNSIPPNVTKLEFITRNRDSPEYDQSILPSSILSLNLGFNNNTQFKSDSIPPKTTHLSFGGFGNITLEADLDFIPQSVQHISMGHTDTDIYLGWIRL